MSVSREKILELLPEIEQIADPGLKELTLKVWFEAVKKSGWSEADLKRMPFTLLLKAVPVSLIEHTRSVTKTAVQIGDVLHKEYRGKVRVDRDALLSGAILHDVGKLFEYTLVDGVFVKSKAGELLRHPIAGAAFAYQFGVPEEIVHIIAAHSKEGDGGRRTIEAIIVNHADFVNFDVFK
ncbi:MAG: HD domain-containing protein [Candidatus Aminicenantales bacterium]